MFWYILAFIAASRANLLHQFFAVRGLRSWADADRSLRAWNFGSILRITILWLQILDLILGSNSPRYSPGASSCQAPASAMECDLGESKNMRRNSALKDRRLFSNSFHGALFISLLPNSRFRSRIGPDILEYNKHFILLRKSGIHTNEVFSKKH